MHIRGAAKIGFAEGDCTAVLNQRRRAANKPSAAHPINNAAPPTGVTSAS
jgi:hypothetical protein